MKKYYYGAKNSKHIKSYCESINARIFGNKPQAIPLMYETLAVETNFCMFKDPTPKGAGAGATQIDQLPFKDFQERMIKFYPNIVKKINEYSIWCGLRIDFEDWEWHHLMWESEQSLTMSIIMMRCAYWLVAERLPDTLEGRAKYWKKYYNTALGKGTIRKYIEKSKIIPK